MAKNVFSLRFHDDGLRTLVQAVASRDGVSQNDLIETAIRNEVVFRGELLADQLASTAARLREMSDAQREELIERSIDAFERAEARPEPFQAVQVPPHPKDNVAERTEDPFGILAGFSSL
ncbi:MAG: hypothetical protein ACYDGN_12970 [Acidimicrobiales bacterium]